MTTPSWAHIPLLVVLLTITSACGSRDGDVYPEAPPIEEPTAADEEPTAAEEEPSQPPTAVAGQTSAACADAEACLAQARQLLKKKQYDEAIPLLEGSCAKGQADACLARGDLWVQGLGKPGQDKAQANKLYMTACERNSARGCYNAGTMHYDKTATGNANAPAIKLLRQACTLKYASGCTNAGIIVYNGRGVPADKATGTQLLEDGCKLGDRKGCLLAKDARKKMKSASSASSGNSGAGASITDGYKLKIRAGKLSADGLKVEELVCGLDSGGFLASALVIGALAKQKRRIHKCKPRGGDRPRVRWSFTKKGVEKVEIVSSKNKKVARCLERAVKRAAFPTRGRCEATIVLD